MVAAKSVPQNHLADPFEAVLRPPPGETSAQRDARILAEQLAKRVSDSIDEQLRAERAELKKNRPDVRILLLGQSESGKSTTLKRTCTVVLFFTCQLDRGHAYLFDVSIYLPTPRKQAYVLAFLFMLTLLVEFQLLHTPAAFQAERMAWRFVIYLNLIRSVRRCVLFVTPTPVRRRTITS
jgi:guanine nucleotide-binding protein subunit alpha